MTKPTVLIVEDDPTLGNIFTLALQTDFEAELCADGTQALTRLQNFVPDLMVLDLHLPGASGQQILEYVRGCAPLAKTRVILATADHLQADFLGDKAEIALLKPISPFQLRELAVRLVRR